VNTDSGIVNTDSGNYPKSVHLPPESLFTFDQNRCSPSTRITVHLAPVYAQICQFDDDLCSRWRNQWVFL